MRQRLLRHRLGFPVAVRVAVMLLVAVTLLAGCGSAGKSGSSSVSTTAAHGGTTPQLGPSVVIKLRGSDTGSKPNLATLGRIPKAPHASLGAHLKGLEGLSLSQKLQSLSSDVGSLWLLEFSRAQTQLPPATVNIIDQTPAVCGSNQIVTTDPPEYCSGEASVNLPLAFIHSNVAPIGDAALALVVADIYGYHIENAIGALNQGSGLNRPDVEKIDSCLSGIYFLYAESQQRLQPGDEAAVNRLLAAKASATRSPAGTGQVSAADLTAAFNKGILGNGDFHACLPPGVGGGH